MNSIYETTNDIYNAVNIIKQGGLIAYPTEAMFGLGCDPFNKDAVLDLLHLKQRSVDKGLILVASHIQHILPLIKPLSANDLARALKTWPGHYTWLFPKSKLVPDWISGNHETIAIRVSSHPTIIKLCSLLNGPLVSTSANISSQKPLLTIKDLKSNFGDKIQCYFDAPIGKQNTASIIRDAHTLKLIR